MNEDDRKKYLEEVVFFYDKENESFFTTEFSLDNANDWHININVHHLNNEDREDLLLLNASIRSYAYVLALNSRQMKKKREAVCKRYWKYNRCTTEESYLWQFIDEFWSDEDFIHERAILSNKRESKQDRLREQYYEKNQDKFFTSESTHSPTYDFAESFLAFVINDRPPELGKKIDEKMDFFYSFEELVDTREKIRVKFTSSLD